jgi:hypothetical protein
MISIFNLVEQVVSFFIFFISLYSTGKRSFNTFKEIQYRFEKENFSGKQISE